MTSVASDWILRLYGVADWRIREIVEVFIGRENAEAFVAGYLSDEPDWADVLTVETITFEMSKN